MYPSLKKENQFVWDTDENGNYAWVKTLGEGVVIGGAIAVGILALPEEAITVIIGLAVCSVASAKT